MTDQTRRDLYRLATAAATTVAAPTPQQAQPAELVPVTYLGVANDYGPEEYAVIINKYRDKPEPDWLARWRGLTRQYKALHRKNEEGLISDEEFMELADPVLARRSVLIESIADQEFTTLDEIVGATENEIRKDFTISERVVIGEAVEAIVNERRRRPAENVPELAQIPAGQKTRNYAAKKAGFGGHETYRKAEVVVRQAEPEIIDAMDNNVISINTAHQVSDEPRDVQLTVARKGHDTMEGILE